MKFSPEQVGYAVQLLHPEWLERIEQEIEARQESLRDEWLTRRDSNVVQGYSELYRNNHLSMVNKVKEWRGYK